MTTATWTTSRGETYPAIVLSWAEVEEILGHAHNGTPEDDGALVAHLVAQGAPEWVRQAPGENTEEGWYLVNR